MSLHGIWKETYRNHGVYYFIGQGYGDETRPMHRTIGEMRAAIDARIAEAEAAPVPDHERYWSTLSNQQRRWWRHNMDWESGLTVSEQAFAAHQQQQLEV